MKVGSDRAFCYMMAPGQDYYHRLVDGELFVHYNEERLCFACAERRGLISTQPRALREPQAAIDLEAGPATETLPLAGEDDGPDGPL